MEQIIDGEFRAIVSDITLIELEGAPKHVRELADKVIAENAEFIIAGNTEKDLADKINT